MSKLLGAERLIKKLQNIEKITLEQSMEKACKYVQDEARKRVPVDTSELQKSINHKVTATPKQALGVVYTNNEYAVYVEFGTGPTGQSHHDGISPEVNVRYSPDGWRYFDENTQQWVYTKGQKAQPYLYPAIHYNHDKIISFLSKELNEVLRGKNR